MRAVRLLLWASLVAVALTARAQGPGTDPELETGIRLVDEGNFEAGIKALDAVLERLKAASDQPRALSRAYLYLGIAHLQLSQQQASRARFMEAARHDHNLKLSSYEFPPNVVEAFEEARKGVAPQGPPKVKVPPTVFLDAVKTGDFAAVRRLVSEDPSLLAARDAQFDATALHWAALRGHAAVAALLVAQGADVGARNNAGETPQQVASRANSRELTAILAPPAGGPGAEAPSSSGGTIFEAAKAGDAARVREILQANPGLASVKDTAFGATPLHWAALRGHVEVARVLIGQGADAGAENSQGETPLEVARRAKHGEVANLVQEAARAPQVRFFEAARAGDAGDVRRLLAESPALVREKDVLFGATALHWAALRGHAEVARVLIEGGADQGARNLEGETPEQVARRGNRKEVMALLASPAAPGGGAPSDSGAAVVDAAKAGDVARVRELLATNPGLVGAKDGAFGATPLHWAALRGHAEVVRVLLEGGADREARNKAGETPLEVAQRAGRAEVVRVLSR